VTERPSLAPRPPLANHRSPERQRLADAIARHAGAAQALARVAAAQTRLTDQLYDQLEPAATAAREAFEAAQKRAPELLVAAALSEPAPAGPSVPAAEAALAAAQRAVADCRAGRQLLADEAARAAVAAKMAERALDNAVKAVVATDPARAALYDAFVSSARRALRCVAALRTAGLTIGGIEAHGVRFDFREAATAIGEHAFRHDPEWVAALAALREVADAALPGLPPDEPEPDDAGDSRAAA
jgi:hypothetical protein